MDAISIISVTWFTIYYYLNRFLGDRINEKFCHRENSASEASFTARRRKLFQV